jgi:DNA primase
MSDEQQAKYLNSPDTPLFDKSGELYALNWARESIAKSDQAVVVEGYFDALIPLQAGVGNVVATLGTSLTDRHVRMLSHYAREVVLVFDADVAGAAAAERALEIFLQQQLQVRVATIPAGKDPCDYCLAEGADALRTLLADAPDALEYVWSRRQQALQQAGGNLANRRQVVEDFLRLIASSSAYGAIDEVRKGQLAQHIGQMLNIAPADLQREMKRLVRKVPTRSAPGGSQGPGGGQYASDLSAMAERQVLEVLLAESDFFDHAAERIGPEDFQHPEYRMLAGPIWTRGMEGTLSVEEMLADEGLAEAGAMLTELAISGQRRGNYQATLDGAVECILFRRHRQETEKLKEGGLDNEMTLRRIHQNAKGPSPRRFPRFS